MSTLTAKITDIQNIDNLNIVKFDFYGNSLKMMSLDLGSETKVGKKVKLSIKPSHVAIAKDLSGILSYSNQIKAKVVSIANGQLLSSIKLSANNSTLESIITYESVKKMDLNIDDEVTILIKASELSILKVLDD